MTDMQKTEQTFLLIICETEFSRRVVQMMVDMGVEGFTFAHGAAGGGRSGRREDTDIWPGANSTVFVALEDEQMAQKIVDGAEQIIRTAYRKRPGFAVFKLNGSQIA